MLLPNYTFLSVFWEENNEHSFSGSDPIPSPTSHLSNFLHTSGTLGILGPLAAHEVQHVLAHTLGPESQMPSLLVYLENPSSSIKKGPWKFFWPTYTWFGSSRTSCASLFIPLYLLPGSRIFEVSRVCVCAHTHVHLVAQSHVRLCNSMDCNLPDSSVHGVFQARILEWVAIPFSTRSEPRNQTWVSYTGRQIHCRLSCQGSHWGLSGHPGSIFF